VNGIKKWITGAYESTYFTTAVRTSEEIKTGLSMLLIERSEGVSTTLIKTSYSSCAGTSLVKFHNVKVPVDNLIGVEGNGLKQIMYNFNHERLLIVINWLTQARKVIEECFKWLNQR